MVRYAARRLVQTIPTLVVISVLTFLLVRLIPGDPAILIAGEEATPEVLAGLRERLGLDRPLAEQYLIYLGDVVRADLGHSIRSKQPVARELAARIPATVELALAAAALFTVLGTGLGVAAAVWRNRWPDHAMRVASLLGVSTPSFWLGVVLILLFSVHLRLLPVAGRGSLAFLVLPAVTVALDGVALLARLVRASLLEVLAHDYVRTARAKGLMEVTVVLRHALRNALIPAVTVLGLEFGRLLGGVVVVESVFGWPGFGRLLITAIQTRDYPVVQSAILLFAGALIAVNLAVDLCVGLLDPRVRYR
jgi:peptide/nickel transport system permease protein/oligopeptide transport system permease protein